MNRLCVSDEEVLNAIKDYGEVTTDTIWSIIEVEFPELINPKNDIEKLVDDYYNKALDAFSVCPSCGVIIDTLIEKVSGFKMIEFKVTGDTNSTEEVWDYGFEADDGGLWYLCPSCNDIIFEDLSDAIKFLGK